MAIRNILGPPNVAALKKAGNVRKLIDALAYDKDTEIQLDAVDALGLLKDERAVEPLVAALGPLGPPGHARISIALSRIGDKRAFKPLLQLAARPISPERLTVIRALGDMADPRLAEPLAKIFRAGDGPTRGAAVEALRKIGPPAIPYLTEVIKVASEQIHLYAAEALGLIGDPKAVEPLKELLASRNAEVRIAASRALSRFQWQPKEPTALIRYALDLGLEEHAAQASTTLMEPLVTAAHNWDASSITAVRALARNGSHEALDVLMSLLRSPDASPRFWSALVLSTARIDLGTIVPALFKVLRDPDFGVASSALFSILQITRRLGESLDLGTYHPTLGLEPNSVDMLRTIRDIENDKGYHLSAAVRLKTLGLVDIADLALGEKILAHRILRERLGLPPREDGDAIAVLVNDVILNHPEDWLPYLDRIVDEFGRLMREESIHQSLTYVRELVREIEIRRLRALYADEPRKLEKALRKRHVPPSRSPAGRCDISRRLDIKVGRRFVPFWWVRIREVTARKEQQIASVMAELRTAFGETSSAAETEPPSRAFNWMDQIRDPRTDAPLMQVEGRAEVDGHTSRISTVIRCRRVGNDGRFLDWEEGEHKAYGFHQLEDLRTLGKVLGQGVPGSHAGETLEEAIAFIDNIQNHNANVEQAKRNFRRAQEQARQAMAAAQGGDWESAKFAAYDAISTAALVVPSEQMEPWNRFMDAIEKNNKGGLDLAFLAAI